MADVSLRNVHLDNSILLLTGGQDVTGHLLLTLPTSRVADLGDQSVAELTSLFLRMMDISRYTKPGDQPAKVSAGTGTPPVAFLADLRQAPTQALYPLVEALEAVEHHQRGSIAAVYFLKPKSSSKSHVLKKLLGMKPSKKRPRVPLFKIVLMKTIQELYTQVDMHHLTLDFSGTLKYSHHAWMYLYENIVQCIEEGKDLASKLPSIKDRVDLLQEYEPDSQSLPQLQQLLTDLTEKFHHIIMESTLPACLTRCKQTLFSLDNISSGSLLSSLHPNLLNGFRSYLHTLYSELDQWNKSLEEAWRITESHFTLIIQYNRHKERAKEIEHKICDHYYPLLKEHPIVGRTLSQAELYRAHFTTTLYEPAKELLSQATEILEAMQKVKTSAASLSNDGVSSSLVEAITGMDISSISKHLTTSIQPFTVHMQELQELYVSIHVFHLLFEKALSWYKKVLKFLPESLLHSWTKDSDISQSDLSLYDHSFQGGQTQVIYMPPEWLGAVRVFLDRHPPPREEHINRLDISTPNVVDKKLRAQARSLALRLRILQRVLSSTRLPLKLAMAVTGWKFELFGPSHLERSSGHAHSTSSPMKEMSRKSNPPAQSEEESTAQESKWVSSSNAEEMRNDSSGTSQNKKSVYFDQATTNPVKSSLTKKKKEDMNTGKADQLANRRAAIANRIQQRRNSKSLLRAKSVEFSFNSSSTDGSVFDYGKAVSQARQLQEHERPEQEFSKLRSGLKDMPMGEGYPRPDDPVPNDLPHEKEMDDYQNDMLESNINNKVDGNTSFKTDPSPVFDVTSYEEFPGETKHRTLKEKYVKKRGSETQNSGERYIGLSYRSWPLQPQYKGQSRYYSMDNLLHEDQSAGEEEFESGIETMDQAHTDPYDLVVKRIKDISASDLPNFEKFRYVSTIIANSPMMGQKNVQQPQNAAAKLSYSTFDLTERNFAEGMKAPDNKSRYEISHFTENPVEAVVRMKQNLARSMEDISTYKLSMLSDDGGRAFSKVEIPSSSFETHPYLTEWKNQPSHSPLTSQNKNYDKPYDTLQTPVRKYNPELNDNSVNKTLHDVHEARPSSDPQTKNILNPNKNLHLHHHDRKEDRRQQQTNEGVSHSVETSLPHRRKTSLSRPTNLNFLAGRTFISPSFLRPASSMKNLSAQGQGSLTFDLMKSMDLASEKDLVNNSENTSREEYCMKGKDNLPQHDLKDEDQRTDNTEFPHTSRDENKTAYNSKDVFRKKCPSLEQNESGYAMSPVYPKRPWSLSIDATVYPVFQQEDEQCHSQMPVYSVERLKGEAELASQDQEEVAKSLRKTQQILEEEEKRRINQVDEMSLENDEDEELPQVQLAPSESIDNGYGSWASKLVSTHSTSSEGPEMDNSGNDDWISRMTPISGRFETPKTSHGRLSSTRHTSSQASAEKMQDNTF